jgi:hypothetical protein
MNDMRLRTLARCVAIFVCCTLSLTLVVDSRAALFSSYVFQGQGNWSVDGASTGNNLQIQVPIGSTVSKAFLYASTALGTPAPAGVTPEVQLGAVTYGPSSFQPLEFIAFPGHTTGLQAFRADVTSQINVLIGGGSISQLDVPVTSVTSPVGQLNGFILAVIYSNPNEPFREIVLLDGGSIGAQFTIDLHQPLNLSNPGFEALLSLGIGFTANTFAQRTEVSVGNRLLTKGAGGSDDGASTTGGITVGGIGDSTINPVDPPVVDNFNVRDDEFYNLALGNGINANPFVANGQHQISFSTVNIGSDDNLFFVGLNVVVPEPTTATLVSLATVAVGCLRRRLSRRLIYC